MSKRWMEDAAGHQWMLDEQGELDEFAFDIQGHSGPKCAKCGYFFCKYCWDVEGCKPLPECTHGDGKDV